MTVLESQRLQPEVLELHSFDDLDPTIEKIDMVKSSEQAFGCKIFINPGLEPGAFRFLPRAAFRMVGRIAEWNVQELGHVTAVIDIEGIPGVNRIVLDSTEVKKEEPGETPDPS